MAITLYFSENKAKGVQLSADAMDMFQKATKLVEDAFICMMGDNGIVCGVEEIAPGVYNPGIIIYNGELLYFEGGEIENFISITEETTECFFCSNTKERIWTIRTAKFSVLGPGLAVTEGLPELYRPEYTFFTLDAQVVQNKADIIALDQRVTTLEETIVTNTGDILNLQELLNNFSTLYSLQQSQINYLLAHMYDCCAEPPAEDTTFAGTTIELCSEENQGRITYTLNLVAPGVTDFTVTQKILEVPTATPSVVSSTTLTNMIAPAPGNMRAEIANIANTNNKFKLQIQYTQSAIVKTGLLVFDLPHFAIGVPICYDEIPVTFYPTSI